MKNVMDLVENDVLADGRVVAGVDGNAEGEVFVTFDDGLFECFAPEETVEMGGEEFAEP